MSVRVSVCSNHPHIFLLLILQNSYRPNIFLATFMIRCLRISHAVSHEKPVLLATLLHQLVGATHAQHWIMFGTLCPELFQQRLPDIFRLFIILVDRVVEIPSAEPDHEGAGVGLIFHIAYWLPS